MIIESYASKEALAANNIHYETSELARRGIKISVITNVSKNEPKHEKLNGVDVYGISCGQSKLYFMFFIIKTMRMIWKINKKDRINIIHAQWAVVSGFVAMIAGRILGVPSIVTCRGFDVNYSDEHPEYGAYRGFLPRVFVKLSLKYIDHIVCVSNSLKNNIKKLWGIDRKCIYVMYPAVSRSFITRKTSNNVINKIPVILTVGGLRKIKRIEDVLVALGEQAQKGLEFEYWIVGPPLGNLTDLELLVAKYKIKNNVKFLGHVRGEQLIDIYDQADIYINASSMEGFGRTYLEAMARGKPVILTSATGCAEIIRNMETGVIVPPYSPEKIAYYIEMLVKNEKLRDKIGKAAYLSVRENHTPDIWANNFMRFAHGIIKCRPDP